MVAAVREIRADIPIISRARDADHASRLYRMGVTDAVPRPSRRASSYPRPRSGIGVPMGYVIASIHEKRDSFRAELQAAAHEAGALDIHAVRRPRGPNDGGDAKTWTGPAPAVPAPA